MKKISWNEEGEKFLKLNAYIADTCRFARILCYRTFWIMSQQVIICSKLNSLEVGVAKASLKGALVVCDRPETR